jgi:hypothetical protein
MFDNLRNQSDPPFFQEEEANASGSTLPEPVQQKESPFKTERRSFDQVTRTTALQRFVLAVMFLIMVCLIGVMLLVLTGKINLAFLY